MPSSLTTAMETEMRTRLHRVHPVVELTLGGTVYKFAEHPVVSESAGIYLPYITSIGTRRRSANVSEYSLEITTISISIFDQERVLQKLFGGPLRGQIKNSKMEIWWRSYGGADNAITSGDHYLDFSGIVDDYSVSDRVFSFTCIADVADLNSKVKIPFWSEEDWPDAPEATLGASAKIIYGRHLSNGISDTFGMIKCFPLKLETNGDVDVWGVAYGACSSVPRVYVDEVIRTTEFTSSRALRGKNYYQILTFTGGGTNPTKDSKVTCDVEGLTTKPDGTGTLIENPAEQIRHFLTNFVYGTGDVRPLAAWASESGKPISTTTFDNADDFFRHRNWIGTMVVEAGETSNDVFNTWCQNFNAVPFFTDTWKIGAIPRNNGEYTLYYDDRHAAQKLLRARDLGLTTSRQDPISDIKINYLLDENRGTFTRAHFVAWRRDGAKIVEKTFDMKFGKRSTI